MRGDSLDSACREALERRGVPGAVVAVLADGETDVRAYGEAELGGAPMRAETTFLVASITKPFTATLALSLVDDGLLGLDEPVPLALPEAGITLRHLLSHLGGFASENGDLARFGEDDDALARLAAELRDQQQVVPPGTVWSYCNAGYWAAGHLCALAAGEPYELALRRRVLDAFGLTATGFGDAGARGHVQPDPAEPLHEPAGEVPFPRARRSSGGLVSSAPDLLRFAAAHLRDERLARLRAAQAETPGGAYGLGWMCEPRGGLEVWFHPGGYGGFATVLALVPERSLAFTVLTNGSGGGAVVREVSDVVLETLCGVPPERPRDVELGPAELRALAGDYASPEAEVRVEVDGGGLALDVVVLGFDGSRMPLPRLEARCVGPRTFAFVDWPWEDERFDFVPAAGPPRFVRLAGRLVARC